MWGSGAWGWRCPGFGGAGFHLVVRGEAWLITPVGAPQRVRTGDVVFTPWGAEHGLSHAPVPLTSLPGAVLADLPPRPAQPDVEFLSGAYWLDHGQVHHYLSSLPDAIVVSSAHQRNPDLRHLVELLRTNLQAAGPGAGMMRPALLDLMLTHLLRQGLNEAPMTMGDASIARVLEQIHAAPERQWTVTDLSEIAGLSKTSFTQRFVSIVGQPPKRYLTGWRLASAARLLRETDTPLASIARQVGYSTEFALSNAFRREYSVSPGRFRNAVR